MKRAYPSTFAGVPRRFAALLILAALAVPGPASGQQAGKEKRLPVIGPAPPFALTSQDGKTVTLAGLRGKVVAVTFIYTSCPDICPLLTEKMAQVQDDVGPNFGSKIVFVSITLDPEHDTSQVLKDYAQLFGAKPEGWVFLRGPLEAIRDLTRRYGVFFEKKPDGSVDHTQLTTLIDADGQMRVQYLGARFDPEEFEHDLTSLIEKE
jgi:protein SCO1/2